MPTFEGLNTRPCCVQALWAMCKGVQKVQL